MRRKRVPLAAMKRGRPMAKTIITQRRAALLTSCAIATIVGALTGRSSARRM
jgi:hypothetical protein